MIYFEANGITLYQGDCRDVLPTLGAVDHVITDPPYSEETHRGARSLRLGPVEPERNGYGDGEPTIAIDFAPVDGHFVRSVMALANPLRWTISTLDWRHAAELHLCPPADMRFVRLGVWVKPDGAPQFTGDRPATGWEAIAILHKLGGKMRWNGGGNRAVWTHNIAREEHPTAKPLSLLSELVTLFTDPGETILDPFCGSGTTLVAAYQLGRKCIGVELEEKWAEVTAKRLEREMAQGRFDLSVPEKPVQQEIQGWADVGHWVGKEDGHYMVCKQDCEATQ